MTAECVPGTGWTYCAHGPDSLTVCTCDCTCVSQSHCPRLSGRCPRVTVAELRRLVDRVRWLEQLELDGWDDGRRPEQVVRIKGDLL